MSRSVLRNVLPLLLAVLGALLLSACGDDAPPGTRLTYPPQQFQIGAGLNPVLSHTVVLPRQTTDHARLQRETGVAWSDWTRVVPRRASLQINEPGLDWGFCEEVIIRAFVGEDASVAREIFYRDQIRFDEGPRLDMIPSELDVRDLLDGPEVTFLVELRRLRQSPRQSLPVTLTLDFGGFAE